MGRFTEQKQIVLDAFKKGTHLTAEELYEKIKKTYPDFSRATMYRNLAYFCESGVLDKVSIKNNIDRYELSMGRHYHLVCEKCGKVENIFLPNPLETPKQLMGYDVDYHELTFYGTCPKCKK